MVGALQVNKLIGRVSGPQDRNGAEQSDACEGLGSDAGYEGTTSIGQLSARTPKVGGQHGLLGPSNFSRMAPGAHCQQQIVGVMCGPQLKRPTRAEQSYKPAAAWRNKLRHGALVLRGIICMIVRAAVWRLELFVCSTVCGGACMKGNRPQH